MKKTMLFLLILVSIKLNAQHLIREECYGDENSSYVVTNHENSDSTTTLVISNFVFPIGYTLSSDIMKLDKNKNVILQRSLEGIDWLSEQKDVVFDPDGNFFILNINHNSSYGTPFYVAKFNKDGERLWLSDSLGINYPAFFGFALPNGGCFLYHFGNNSAGKNCKIIAISNNGHVSAQETYSVENLLPDTAYGYVSTSSAIALKNGNVLISLTRARGTTDPGWPADSVVTVHFLYNPNGTRIASDTVPGYTAFNPEEPYARQEDSLPIFYLNKDNSKQLCRVYNISNLSLVHSQTFTDSIYTNGAVYNNILTDTSRRYDLSTATGLLTCRNFNFEKLWQLPLNNYQTSQYGNPFFVVDNHTVFVNNTLIRDGAVIWNSNTHEDDYITYQNKSWIRFRTALTKDYNGTDLCIITTYTDQICFFTCPTPQQFFFRIQIVDAQSGTVKERMLLDTKYYANYISHYAERSAFIYSTEADRCHFGNKDLYLAYYSGAYNSITGIAYIDQNTNNHFEITEPLYPFGYVSMTGSRDTQTQLLRSTDPFLFYSDTGSYTFSPHLYNNYYQSNPLQILRSYTTYTNDDTLFFALHPTMAVSDGEISLVNNARTRMGQSNSYTIAIANSGTTLLSGRAKLIIDPRLANVSASPSYSYKNGDTMVWNISNLSPAHSLSAAISFNAQTPPSLNTGDTITSQAWFENDSTDFYPAGNAAILREEIRGSYDPNEKTILSGSSLTPQQVANGDYISYIIHFQNTGNDTAYRVIVIDTLSANTDVNSLQIINASAPYTLEIFHDHILKFTFENMKLSSDTTSLSSTGYVAYKVKAKPTLAVGNTIDNRADILFDFNLPVKTNTVQTRIVILTAAPSTKSSTENLSVYPNPSNGIFTVRYENKNAVEIKFEVIDLTGKIIFTAPGQQHQLSEFTIDGTSFAKGIYWIKISDGNSVETKAIIVQ